jgi:hypothetical protein
MAEWPAVRRLLVIAIVYVALTYLPLPPIVRQVGVVVLVIGGPALADRTRHRTPIVHL